MPKELIDYALPLMQAEQLVKDAYNLMLNKQPEEAVEAAKAVLGHMCDAILMMSKEIDMR